MRIRRFFVMCSVLSVAAPALVCAQDTHKVGVTMGYPASVGLLWHVSPKVAIRPAISFTGSSSETTTTVSTPSVNVNTSSDSWGIGTSISALFYLRTYDHLRTYFSPQFTYVHSSGSSTTDLPSVIPGSTTSPLSSEQTGNSTGGVGSFGAQYMLGERFSVFGEFGFGFNHSSSSVSTSITKSTGNQWGTRAGVGVVFYP